MDREREEPSIEEEVPSEEEPLIEEDPSSGGQADDAPGTPAVAQTAATDALRQLRTFLRGNIVWVIGLTPFILAALRLLVESGGNLETLKALAQNLDIVAISLTSLLPVVGAIFLFWAWMLVMAARGERDGVPKAKSGGPGPLLAWIAVPTLVFVAVPLNLLLVLVGIIAVLVLYVLLKDVPVLGMLVSLALLLTVITVPALTLLAPLFYAGMWLPREKIEINNGCVVIQGYVVASDEAWTKILDYDRNMLVYKTDDVSQRTPLPDERSRGDKTALELLLPRVLAWR
ncbi:hypothetical protein BCA37_10880 [Mycobacterium sp. djl-10]|nr:hypothetical protein BCA37_10880 [Mycobacterium sp. djl-10]